MLCYVTAAEAKYAQENKYSVNLPAGDINLSSLMRKFLKE